MQPAAAIEPPLPDVEGKARLARYRFVSLLGKGTFAEVAKYEVVEDEQQQQQLAASASASASAGPSFSSSSGFAQEPTFVAIKSVNRLSYRSGVNLGAVKELQALAEVAPLAAPARPAGSASYLPPAALAPLPHRNVVRLLESFAFGDRVHLVLEFCASDLARTLRDRSLALGEAHAKGILQQLLRGVAHVHACGLMHRDLKPDNVLITGEGVVKLADFGHAGPLIDEADFAAADALGGAAAAAGGGDNGGNGGGGSAAAMDVEPPPAAAAAAAAAAPASAAAVAAAALGARGDALFAPRSYFFRVVTLWYRAPELLLGARFYSGAVDMWAVGCILAEVLLRQPLFPAQPARPELEEREQLAQIFRLMGTPIDPLADPQAAAAAYAAAGIALPQRAVPASGGGSGSGVGGGASAGAATSAAATASFEAAGAGSSATVAASSSATLSSSSSSSDIPFALPVARPQPLAANLPCWPGCASLPGACAFEPRRPQPWRRVFPLEPGSPPAFQGPGASALALDLLSQLLVFDPARRLSAGAALRHPWFSTDPLPAPPGRLPVSLQRAAPPVPAPRAPQAPQAAAVAAAAAAAPGGAARGGRR